MISADAADELRERALLDERLLHWLADVWSDDALRKAYRLDTLTCPLEAALNAWAECDEYGHDSPSAGVVLRIVGELALGAGPDCYPELFDDMLDYSVGTDSVPWADAAVSTCEWNGHVWYSDGGSLVRADAPRPTHRVRWTMPAMSADALNDLMRRVAPGAYDADMGSFHPRYAPLLAAADMRVRCVNAVRLYRADALIGVVMCYARDRDGTPLVDENGRPM